MQAKSPVVLVVMDGIGVGNSGLGDAVNMANTPNLDNLYKNHPFTLLKAHGTAVGLPSDEDVGNSEVGHNALGCGQVYTQGAKLVNESIESGRMYATDTWRQIIDNCKRNNSALHFVGLLSDGNVHSNIDHLKKMLARIKQEGIKRARIHILLDGRDVAATSALEYVDDLEKHLSSLNDASFDAVIASGGGRMKITMDRYQANWDMVKLGWETHVLGIGRMFSSASEAIITYRNEHEVIDQDLPPFVIERNGAPAGTIEDNDGVILFNFRGDRAIEISMAFEYDDFSKFDRKRYPKVIYAGMLQYDGDIKLPARFLVPPPDIRETLSELLVNNGVKQFAISETQKYGHVTYFCNGNRSGKFSEDLEDYMEIPSDRVSFDERPWMKCAEITDAFISTIQSRKYGFLRCNFPNGDMVGHTGSIPATVIGVESVDLCLGRIMKAVNECGAVLLVTADHGNADDMLEKTKSGGYEPKTAHSLNPVPFVIYGPGGEYAIKKGNYGLANVAPTIAALLGLDQPKSWEKSMI